MAARLLAVEIHVCRKLMWGFSMKSKKISPDTYIIPLGLTSISDITLQQIASSYFLHNHGIGKIQESGKVPVF